MNKTVNQLYQGYEKDKNYSCAFINRKKVLKFFKEIEQILFLDIYQKSTNKLSLKYRLSKSRRLLSACRCKDNALNNKIDNFYDSLPTIREKLLKDIDMTFLYDPAANSKQEIVLTYPGILAITAYRVANCLYNLGLSFIARVISEYAHSKTGIDINPGAKIGESFFIDHGTGIVIGETAIIGNRVRIYQGVTIGATSLERGHDLKGIKRHPTIEDNVVIYSGASILGGNTTIGENSIIGGNTFIVDSIEKDSIVRNKTYDLTVTKKSSKNI